MDYVYCQRPTIYITVGISASGKTTWAKEYQQKHENTVIISRDDIRHEILTERKHPNYKIGQVPTNIWNCWKFKDEKEVTERWWKKLSVAIENNSANIILADTNLNRQRLEDLIIEIKKQFGNNISNIIVKEFPVSFEEACRRDALRPDGVGYQVIWKQYKQWEQYNNRKKYIPNQSLPKAIVCDVDGTLAIMKNRGPFDWNKVETDQPRYEIIDMLRGFFASGYRIVILSGRDGCCKEQTENWLRRYEIPYDNFYMRNPGDSRKDSIIKEELFWNYVAPKYNVKLIIDDRPQVVRLWSLLGLSVAAVADQLNEF